MNQVIIEMYGDKVLTVSISDILGCLQYEDNLKSSWPDNE